MCNLEIVVDDNVFITSNTNVVNTGFYICLNGKLFPNEKWTDFTFPILEEWKNNLLQCQAQKKVHVKLYFHDGPYRMDVYKNDEMKLEIKCIADNNIILDNIKCGYYEFLVCIYDAMKNFVKILYQSNLHEGEFQSIYKQTILSIKEIRRLLDEGNYR